MIGSSKSRGSRADRENRGRDRDAGRGPSRPPAERSEHGRNGSGGEGRLGGKRRHVDADEAAEAEPVTPPARPANGRRISGAAAVQSAKDQLLELTGQPCESVSALSRTREGWRVVLEVVELERIPRTTDIMASYLVELDEEGELMGYQRTNRYYRNEVSGES